jgi:hypothetical protein
MRPPLADYNPAHIADSQRSLPRPAVLKTSARADSQKRRSPVPFRIASRARKREKLREGEVGAGAGCPLLALSYPNEASVCPTAFGIDYTHSRAIVREIGERMRASLKPEPELPARFKTQIERLRALEEQSPSIIPAAERWDKPRR